MLYETRVVRTQCCGPSLPKLQPVSNRIMLRKSRCRLVSKPKAENSKNPLSASACPQRKDLWHAPAFAIGLMAGDERPKGSQDRMVPCTTAKHRVAMASITAWTLTRSPEV